MSAEKLIRVKVTLPAGVVVSTHSQHGPISFSHNTRVLDALHDMQGMMGGVFDGALKATATATTRSASTTKSDAEIELSLEVPYEARAQAAKALNRLAKDLLEP